MSLPRAPHESGWLRSLSSQRLTEYIYFDELLLRERRNLARRWWGTFGEFYGLTVVLILLGWTQTGIELLTRPAPRIYVLSLLGFPVLIAAVGFLVWFLWINRRPLRRWHTQFDGKPASAFRVALACVAEAGWTPWEVDYEHQVVVALSPDGMYTGTPPQVITIYCSPLTSKTTEIRIQSRFIEATRLGDPGKILQQNLKTFQKFWRVNAPDSDNPALPMPHPLARLKGRLPEEQDLAVQALGRPRARARLWVVWALLAVLGTVLMHLQPWFNLWVAWPLSFLAAGGFHFLLGNQWNAQEHHALTHATATVIANPYPTRAEMWDAVDQIASAQRLQLHEVLDENARLYRERQPASGYPGTYILLATTRNDAHVEQLMAVAVPEWGLLTALMPQIYAPFHLMALMQALRRGPLAPQPSEARERTTIDGLPRPHWVSE